MKGSDRCVDVSCMYGQMRKMRHLGGLTGREAKRKGRKRKTKGAVFEGKRWAKSQWKLFIGRHVLTYISTCAVQATSVWGS